MTTPPRTPPASTTASGVPDAPAVAPSGAVPSGAVPSGVSDAAATPSVVAWGFPDAVQTPPPDATTADGARTVPKPRAGRRPGAVWGFFTSVRTEQNKTHAVCRFCARRCAGVAARMAAHVLTKCPAVPAHERDALTAALAHDGAAAASAPPPEKRQRLADSSDGSSATSGLAAFGASAGDKDAGDDAALVASALQLIAVACLRARAPLVLVEDAFFRDALALLRPHALAAIKSADAATLRESVRGAVARDAAHWMRASESFTLVYNARSREWRGADSHRRSVLITEASAAWRAELETQLQLLGDDTIAGVCCDARHVYDQLIGAIQAPATSLGRVKLVSKCLLTESARLWALVVDAVPQLMSVVVGAAEIAQTYATLQDPTLTTATTQSLGHSLHTISDWSIPFRVVKHVDTVAHSPQLPDPDVLKASSRADFWEELNAVDALLAPFAWLFTLSESKTIGASQIVLCWLWLLATIEKCPLVTAVSTPPDEPHQQQHQQPKPLAGAVLSAVTQELEDHHLVALLLDPRIRGAGLSATGRRKVKTLVVQVATRLWPGKYESQETESEPAPAPPTSPARQALLTQLSHYIDKTGCFADDVVWEMVVGASPEVFWRDYAQDAPELTTLAMAVLTHVPVASQTNELLDTQSLEQPLDARQIRFHFERNRKHGAFDLATVLATHAELLTPTGGTPPTPSTSVVPTATATALPLAAAVSAALQRLRAVGDTAAALPFADETSTAATEPTTRITAVDATWFAFQSEVNEQEIAAALRRLLPASMVATRPLAPPRRVPSPVALDV